MSAQTVVHGMDGSLEASDWPGLTLEELEPVLASYPAAGRPRRILTVSPRPFSAASIVETSLRQVFVKRHHGALRTLDGLREEHRFLAHLRAHGASVPRVYATASEDSAVALDGWTYEVHSVPAGVDLYREAISWTPFYTARHAHAAGRMLAQLHLAAEGFEAPARAVQPLVSSLTIFTDADPEAALQHYLNERAPLREHARLCERAQHALAMLAPFHAELQPWLAHLKPLWTHNDLHPSNLLWSDASADAHAVTALDFGLADRTFAVWDLAQAIERSLIDWLAIVAPDAPLSAASVQWDQLAALLAGYESVRPLSHAEAHALAPSVALCHYEFALTEADYFLGVVGSEAKAVYAYDSYLVGHARWFCQAGAPLLQALRARTIGNRSAPR